MTEPTQNLTNQSTITLREITRETLNSILDLNVAKSQEDFVAPNAWSIAEAHFSKHAWFRAIYADETPVGFLMLHDQPDAIDGPRHYHWRVMLDIPNS